MRANARTAWKNDFFLPFGVYKQEYTNKSLQTRVSYNLGGLINRGYYTAARRYDFYLRVVKTVFYERAQRVSKILFLTREDKSHILKPPCNVLFII